MTTTLEQMSGERKKSPKLALNEISINGQTGKFVYKDVLGGLKEEGDRKKYDKKELGDKINVVFLKIRRKLHQFRKEERPLVTNEHNHKDNVVSLFGNEDGVKRGTALALREQYEGLRTIQVVYAIYEGELVRLMINGSSLGSKAKAKDVLDFYSYISSFKSNGKDDHFYEANTELFAVEEEGDLGSYFCMSYKEGEKLDTDQMKSVEEKMKIAFEYSNEVDEYFGSAEKKQEDTIQKKDDVPVIEYPDEVEVAGEEINPDDIPF